jgi:hypothetical protein
MSNPAAFFVFCAEFSAAWLVWRYRYRLADWVLEKKGMR